MPAPKSASKSAQEPAVATGPGDIDVHALGAALSRKRRWIIVPTVLAAVLSISVVNLITPRYKSEARILIDGGYRIEGVSPVDQFRYSPHVELVAKFVR